MKNLKYLHKPKLFYDRIAAPKANAANLNVLGPRVAVSYSDYYSNAKANTLHNYAATAYNVAEGIDLGSCYGQEAEVIALKSKIRNRQEKQLRQQCQYCMVGVSETFDHYLPQTSFPEYCVLTYNLIPACDYCNRKKWQNWKNAANERLFINFYFDTLPNVQFLKCQITVRGASTRATFSLVNPGIAAPLYNLIDRHFEKLELLDRLDQHAIGQIIDIGNSMRPLRATHNRAQARVFMIAQANELRNDHGINYCWAILKEELANTPAYLATIGF